jgi:vacuolar-type H+-ATPase subunit I/STV1
MMTDQQTPSGRSTYPRDTSPAGLSTAWTGWVHFGGVLMIVVGAFGVIEGLLALFLPTTYLTGNEVVLTLTFTGWGWLHIVLGALVLALGVNLVRDEVPSWARGTAMVLIALNTIVQLTWLPAYPIWSIVMIVLDVLIIGALAATGDRALRSG